VSPDALAARIAAVAAPFADRVVWASDWPHTTFSSPDAVSYAGLMAPAQAALGSERWRAALSINPARLYGP
jgi:predicted TIM-barrel fold metal-dependent hydrolase